MKKQLMIAVLALSTLLSAPASVTSYNGSAYTIADGNPNGTFSQIVVSGENASLTSLTVSLNISGGYNGDLYGYLSYNGTLITLVNQVGSGAYADAGFNITLADSGALGAIQTYQTVQNPNGGTVTGTWTAADGSLNTAFQGLNPNGTWTLFFADMSGGGGTSTINGWSLNITAVPEPANVALCVFGGMAALFGGIRWRLEKRRRSSLQNWP